MADWCLSVGAGNGLCTQMDGCLVVNPSKDTTRECGYLEQMAVPASMHQNRQGACTTSTQTRCTKMDVWDSGVHMTGGTTSGPGASE